MRFNGNARDITVKSTLVLIAFVSFALGNQKSAAPRRTKSAETTVGAWKIWKSETTGKEYRVKVEPDRFVAEWTNIPAEAARMGAYIRTECRRAGTKWIGTSSILLPCAPPGQAQGKATNTCPMTLRFEVDSISPGRIAGHGEVLKDFDCAKCEVRLTGWGSFTWVPKKK